VSEPPIRVESRAWTGDPSVSPIEREVLGRRWLAKEKSKRSWTFVVLGIVAGLFVAQMLDLLVWGISGSRPYLLQTSNFNVVPIGIAFGAAIAALLLLIGRKNLLPIAPLCALLGGTAFGELNYVQEISQVGVLETRTFFISSLDLRLSRRGFGMNRIKASATLVDQNGHRWHLNGRYKYIAQLVGKKCMTITVRKVGHYGF
jgi:hypothetical protein